MSKRSIIKGCIEEVFGFWNVRMHILDIAVGTKLIDVITTEGEIITYIQGYDNRFLMMYFKYIGDTVEVD